MFFEGRELKRFVEPVLPEDLEVGAVFFSLTFVDEAMLIPMLEPLVFIGFDLEPGDVGQAYFQDFESHRAGARYDEVSGDYPATFSTGSSDELNHIFRFDKALEALLACSLRRTT